MNPEEVKRCLAEIIEALQNYGRCSSFSEVLDVFDKVFRQTAMHHGQAYNERAGRMRECLFFYLFSSESPDWSLSLEVLNTTGHYLIFDRSGRYAIYERNGSMFGTLVFANPPGNTIGQLEGCMAPTASSRFLAPGNTIGQLEGCMAADLLSNLVQLSIQNAQLRENNIAHLRHIASIQPRPPSLLRRLLHITKSR